MRIEAEAQAPNSLISRDAEDFSGWKALYKSCHTLVVELEEVLDKYKSLGTTVARTGQNTIRQPQLGWLEPTAGGEDDKLVCVHFRAWNKLAGPG